MLHLIPRPLHRLALRGADWLRRRYRRVFRPRLAGVSVIALNDRGEVLLVWHSYGAQRWALPGGGMGRGETAEDCARREMAEELRCKLSDVVVADRVEETLSGAPHTAWLVRARIAGTPRPDGREVLEAAWFAPDRLPRDTGALTRARLAQVLGR